MSSYPYERAGEVRQSLGHQPVLDGIRGLAVLVVLGHNLHWPGFKGGMFGVDMFFALSGFLITTLLLDNHGRNGRISLRRFFIRRFLRLYPALTVLVVFSVVSGFWLTPGVSPVRIATVTAAVLGYWSNWLIVADPQAWMGGLSHTWSLAIEMHFYILWALVVFGVTNRRGCDLRVLGVIAAAIATASIAWRATAWSMGFGEFRLYCGTDMRLGAIFLGSGAGLLRWAHLTNPGAGILPRWGRAGVRLVEMIGIGLLAVLVTTIAQGDPASFLGGFSLAGAVTAVLILTALLYEGSLLARVASWPVLTWFGRISYSLYLWHVPAGKLFSSARLSGYGLPPVLVEAGRAGASVALAAMSYYCVERYFLRFKRQPGTGKATSGPAMG